MAIAHRRINTIKSHERYKKAASLGVENVEKFRLQAKAK